MRKLLLVSSLSLVASLSFSGEYSDSCYAKGLAKMDVGGCLSEILNDKQKELDELLDAAQKSTEDAIHTSGYLSPKEVMQIDFSFENYVKEQCENLIGSASSGTGYGDIVSDCEIKMTESRISDVEYLLENYYPEAGKTASEGTLEKDLLGSWNCSISVDQLGQKMTIESEESYGRNGHLDGIGTMWLTFGPGYPEIEYSFVGTSTWEIVDNFIVSVMTDIEVVNLSHPEYDEMFNMKDMFLTGSSDSAEILELSKTKLTLKTEPDNFIYSCERKV
jgi:hypothetical protein